MMMMMMINTQQSNRCGSWPVALRRLVRLAPLHPHIMGNVICAWFGKKTVGRVVARDCEATDDDDDDDKYTTIK